MVHLIPYLILLKRLAFSFGSFSGSSSEYGICVKQRNADPYAKNILEYSIEVANKEDLPLVVCSLYREGFSIRAIANMVGINHMKVYRMLKSTGMRLRKFKKKR